MDGTLGVLNRMVHVGGVVGAKTMDLCYVVTRLIMNFRGWVKEHEFFKSVGDDGKDRGSPVETQ